MRLNAFLPILALALAVTLAIVTVQLVVTREEADGLRRELNQMSVMVN